MPALVDQLRQESPLPVAATHASDDGTVVVLRSAFAASDGVMGHPHQLRLGLAIAGGGRLIQRSAAATLQAHWHPGQFNLVLPGDSGTYASPAVNLLGVAIDTASLPAALVDLHALQPLAARLQRDPVIAAVLQAMWASAEADACLPGFLQQAAQVVLHRLSQLAGGAPGPQRVPTALTPTQLRTLEDLIDQQRGSSLDVPALSAALGMQPSTFSRALRAACGVPPYVFLTQRRMQWARQALQRGLSVTEVAMACGYANPSKFSAAFRRVVGVPPSAWPRQ